MIIDAAKIIATTRDSGGGGGGVICVVITFKIIVIVCRRCVVLNLLRLSNLVLLLLWLRLFSDGRVVLCFSCL